MRRRRTRLGWALALTALVLLSGVIGSTWAAYSGTTSNGANSFSAAAAPAEYGSTLLGTAGLVNYWRLGEAPVPVASDSFTGTAGTALTSHTGEVAASWTNWGAPYGLTTTLALSNENRLRRSGNGYNYYRTSVTPGERRLCRRGRRVRQEPRRQRPGQRGGPL